MVKYFYFETEKRIIKTLIKCCTASIRTMPFIDPYSPKTTTISRPTSKVQTTTTQTTTTKPYLQNFHAVSYPTQTPKINKVDCCLTLYLIV